MKIVVPCVCIAAGIAIGCFVFPLVRSGDKAFPEGAASGAKPQGAETRATSRSGGEDHGSRTRVADRANEPKDKTLKVQDPGEAAKKVQQQMSQRMVDTQRKRFETRLAKLAAELNLSAEQQQQVRDGMEKYLTSYGAIFEMDGSEGSTAKLKDTMDLLKTDGMESSLSGVLQGDQIAKYDQVKAKEIATRADAKALKAQSNLFTAVDDLTQAQKDSIYQAYRDEALTSESKPLNSLTQMYEGMGVQIDDELGFQDFMQDKMEQQIADGSVGNSEDPKDLRSSMKEMVNQKIEAKLATLKPILTDAQLQQYRTHLEDRASGMLNMFGGVVPEEGGDADHGHDTYQVVPKSK